MADGVIDPTPSNLESILNQTHRLSDLIAFLLDLSRMEPARQACKSKCSISPIFLTKPWNLWKSPMPGMRMTSKCMCPTISRWQAIRTACANCSPISSRTRLSNSADNTTVLIEAHENKDFGTIVTNVVNFGSQIRKRRVSDIFPSFSSKGKTGPGTESGGTGFGIVQSHVWAAQFARWFG